MEKILPNTTQVPNVVLDEWLPRLKDVELRVLLIVVRQTLGWVEDHETGRRKEKDWISRGQLMKKTGRGHSSVTVAIEKLIRNGIIEAYDGNGKPLQSPKERSGNKVFYRLNLNPLQKSLFSVDKPVQKMDRFRQPVQNLDVQKVVTTKETYFTKDNTLRTAKTPSAHKQFIDFWYKEVQRARNLKPVITGKDGKNLQRILKVGITENTLEQAAVYFLNHYSFKKFAPNISTLLSAGILNGIMNAMKNDDNFWKELDSYAVRRGVPVYKTGFAEQLEKMKKEAFRMPTAM